MKKFSDIEKLNEEFLEILKKKNKESNQFTKVSQGLLELYCKNILSEDYLSPHPGEKDRFDFEYYKIKSISKVNEGKFNVSMVTYDSTKRAIGEISYLLEINKK